MQKYTEKNVVIIAELKPIATEIVVFVFFAENQQNSNQFTNESAKKCTAPVKCKYNTFSAQAIAFSRFLFPLGCDCVRALARMCVCVWLLALLPFVHA